MKINGTIFSKPQQDQLKRGIGTELDKIAAMVSTKYYSKTYDNTVGSYRKIINDVIEAFQQHKRVFCIINPQEGREVIIEFTAIKPTGSPYVLATGVTYNETTSFAAIIKLFIGTQTKSLTMYTLKADGCDSSSLTPPDQTKVYFEV